MPSFTDEETHQILHQLRRIPDLEAELAERDATIARLHDLVAKFQRGGTSTLYAEGHTDG